MKILLHKPSGDIYPYNSKNPNYCKDFGIYSKETLEIVNMSFFRFYPIYLYERYIKNKRIMYFFIGLLPFKYRKYIYNNWI